MTRLVLTVREEIQKHKGDGGEFPPLEMLPAGTLATDDLPRQNYP